MLLACNTELPRAFRMCEALSTEGYAMADILSTMNRVAKTLDLVPMLKLDILKVGWRAFLFASFFLAA